MQKVRLHLFPECIEIASHVQIQTRLHRFAFIHTVHRARESDLLFDATILNQKYSERTVSLRLIRQKLVCEEPVDDLSVTGPRLTSTPAPDGCRKPSSDPPVRFVECLGDRAAIERLKGIQRVLRSSPGVVRHDPCDTEPTPFIVAEIRVGQARHDPDASREIGVERRRDEVDRDLRDTSLHGGIAEAAPRGLDLIQDAHAFVQNRILVHLQVATELPTRQLQTDELVRDQVLRRHTQCAGQLRRERMRVVAAREQPRDDRLAFEADQRSRVIHPTVCYTIAIGDPARRDPRLREIRELLKGGVRLHASCSCGGPLAGQCGPCCLDVPLGFKQLDQRVADVIESRLRRIGHVERCAPSERREFDDRPLPRHVVANQLTQFFEPGDRGVILARCIRRSADPAGRHEHRAQRVVIPLRDCLQFVIVALGAGHRRGEKDF